MSSLELELAKISKKIDEVEAQISTLPIGSEEWKLLTVKSTELQKEKVGLQNHLVELQKEKVGLQNHLVELQKEKVELQKKENLLHEKELKLMALPAVSQLSHKQYWFVSFRISGSKSKNGWRARVFVLASQCMAFYNVDKSQSVYYDGNHLMIKLLFETLERSRQFYEELRSIFYRFSLVMPLEVISPPHSVSVTYEPLPLLSDHYDTNEYDSPHHSLCASDYAPKSVGGSHEEIFSVCTVSDPHSRLQMIENPDHPFLRGLKMYRCHIEAQATNKKQKSNQNNILHMSWPMHQRFDGLNLVGDKHMVPSIAFKFMKSELEIVEAVSGYPFQKYKVTFGIESNNDLALLEAVGSTLKQGSEFDSENNRWITFVHVDNDEEFKTFLKVKYEIAKELWRRKAPIGEEIEDDQMEILEANAVLQVIKETK